jgi:hypothetical protein
LPGPTVAVLRGDSNVSGVVTFDQPSESSPTTISWEIAGNDPLAQRGMHIHQFGDNTNGCTSAGPHCKSGPMGAGSAFLHVIDVKHPATETPARKHRDNHVHLPQLTRLRKPMALPPTKNVT